MAQLTNLHKLQKLDSSHRYSLHAATNQEHIAELKKSILKMGVHYKYLSKDLLSQLDNPGKEAKEVKDGAGPEAKSEDQG